MNPPCAKHRAGALATLLLAVLVVLPACRRGAEALPTTRPRPVAPYPGYFQTRVGDDIYLFATLPQKTSFHADPTADHLFALFVSRTGQRVHISSVDPALVPRIEVAYEQALGTELAAFDARFEPSTQPATDRASPQAEPPASDPADEAGNGRD